MSDDEEQARLTIPVGPDDHVRGPADAPVTLVEYGDFECPYCGAAEPAVEALARRYPKQLRVVFRSFPLEQHTHAEKAAEAAEFAADHGKFWEFHDLLYRHQNALDVNHLIDYAKQVGLDGDALATALREGTYAPVIAEVKEGGEDSGIPGTPAFFLNGLLYEDEPTQANLAHAIDYLLKHGHA
ncbi:MAG: DsbA family protein [Vulcanimicrobiaceae bacterium]